MNKSIRLKDNYFEEFMSNPKFNPESIEMKEVFKKISKNDPDTSFLFLNCNSMDIFKRANCNYFRDINFLTKRLPHHMDGIEYKCITRVKQIVLSKVLFDYDNNHIIIPTPTLVLNNDTLRKSATDTSYLNKDFLSGFLYSLINLQIQDLDNRIVVSNKNINIVWRVFINERSLQKNLMDK